MIEYSNNLYETRDDDKTVEALKEVVVNLTNKNTSMEETLKDTMDTLEERNLEIEKVQTFLMRLVNDFDSERMKFDEDLKRNETTIETLRDLLGKLSKQYRKAVLSLEQECKIKKEDVEEVMKSVREDSTKKTIQLFKNLKEEIKNEMDIGSMKQREIDDLRQKLEEANIAKDLLKKKVEDLEIDMKKKEMNFQEEVKKFESLNMDLVKDLETAVFKTYGKTCGSQEQYKKHFFWTYHVTNWRNWNRKNFASPKILLFWGGRNKILAPSK